MAILFNPANARVQPENGFSDYKIFCPREESI